MFFKEIADLGITVVVCGIFLYFAKTIFDLMIKDNKKYYEEILVKLEYAENRRSTLITQNEKLVEVLNRLEERLRTEKVTGKALEMILTLQIQDIRWAIQKKIVKYIQKNHLKENWSIINKEIDTFFNRKLIDFETEMHDIIEGITYKMIHDIIKKEFSETKSIIVQILEGLKEDGTDEKELYNKAIRIVEDHMQTIENELVAHIKELIN
nr:MAG TPA: resistance to inhibitors of cholinesterase-like protein [Caudoviricetes sp.]